MVVSFEEIVRDSAISIVCSDENYHKPSFESEISKLTAILRTLLHNEVDNVRRGIDSDKERVD